MTLLSVEQIGGRICVWPLVDKSTKLIRALLNLLLAHTKSKGLELYQNLFCDFMCICNFYHSRFLSIPCSLLIFLEFQLLFSYRSFDFSARRFFS